MASKTTKGRKNNKNQRKRRRTKSEKAAMQKNTELDGGNYDTCYIDSVHSACFE